MIAYTDLYHTGIIVEDLDAAMDEYSRAFGVSWGLQGRAARPVILAEGVRTVEFAFAYSSEGPHYLELVQAVPGTLWTVPEPGGVHHLGYWCDDLAAGSAWLSAQGMPRVAKVGASDEAEQGSAVFHRGASGYIELVATALKPYLFARPA